MAKGKRPRSAYDEFMRQAAAGRRLRERRGKGQSTWTPLGSQNPDVGVIEDTDHVVSFKTGGPNGNETLIADGDYSTGKEANQHFNDHHDHYGPAREGGWIDKVRGFFSG